MAVDAAIAELRADLRARYGWTHIEVDVERDDSQGLLRASGEVVSLRLGSRLHEILARTLPPSWRVELDLRPLAVRRWCVIPAGGLSLSAEHPGAPRRSLATELESEDGPVGELARDGDATLVRARDGTVGWISAPLDEDARPRLLTEPALLDPELGAHIYAHARTYLGVPYRLGGATRGHIDCSALVQRALVDAAGILVPRNTRDQLAAAAGGHTQPETAVGPGDLLYIHSRRMQRLHVGIASGQGSILHASRTRDAVIEEQLEAFERDAVWTRHVGWIHLREWARTQVGRAHLELPQPIELDP